MGQCSSLEDSCECWYVSLPPSPPLAYISLPVKDNLQLFAIVLKLVNLGFTINDDGNYHGPPSPPVLPDCPEPPGSEFSWDSALDDEDDDDHLDDHTTAVGYTMKRFNIRTRRSLVRADT